MTQLAKRRNGNGLFPFLGNDFMTNRFFIPDLFNDDFLDTNMTLPAANIVETNNHFRVDLSVPGMRSEDFKIALEDNILTISSEKEEEKIEEGKDYKRREFSCNRFSRSFTLPDNADENNIKAKYDNGVLQIIIPKKELTVSKPKKEIKVF